MKKKAKAIWDMFKTHRQVLELHDKELSLLTQRLTELERIIGILKKPIQ